MRNDVCTQPLSATQELKLKRVRERLAGLESVIVAYSGGADSTLLLALCLSELGSDHVLAATADSPSLPRRELDEAREVARSLGARHRCIPSHEMHDERFVRNPQNRCYYCRQDLFRQLQAFADAEGYQQIVYGATADDLGDYRPGMEAARQAGAVAPLLDAGFTKQDVRAVSHQLGLPTWNKPAMACLSSRFPYGEPLDAAKLQQVERAEELLRYQLGFRQVRVRHHGAIARIEVERHELPRLLLDPISQQIVAGLKELGYQYVTVDLEGFRSGSLNETLSTAQLGPGVPPSKVS